VLSNSCTTNLFSINLSSSRYTFVLGIFTPRLIFKADNSLFSSKYR